MSQFRRVFPPTYAPTSSHDDSEVDHFYQQLQETIDQTPKKGILVVQGDWNAVQGDWNAKVGTKNRQAGERFVDPTTMSRRMREVSDL